MHIREPAVAGAFYPMSASELRSAIEKFWTNAKPQHVIATVAPHAGYKYCGKTFASVYSSILPDFETAIIIGPNHAGVGMIATDTGAWRTPLGSVTIDEDFVRELTADGSIAIDSRAHLREHSIEVQLPWLQHNFNNFKFVPVSVKPLYFDVEHMKPLGNRIAEIAKKLGRKVLIIASSDFTHYGSVYGYTPFKTNVSQTLKKVKEMDMEVAGYAMKLMPERLIEVCADRTVCGYGPIAAAVWAAQKLGAKGGQVVDYSTSFDVSKDASAIVGYCGIMLI